MTLFSDYHMHPQGHRVQPYTPALLQPWVDAARARGLTDIAFTDHDRYYEGVSFDAVERLRERNPDVAVRAGIELDNDPVTGAAGRGWVERNWERLDFVLGSVHYLESDTMFDGADGAEQFEGRDIDGLYEGYYRRVREMIGTGLVDCLSHLDLIKIHRFRSRTAGEEMARSTLELVRKRGLAIELSTAGWRKPVGEQYPAKSVIRLAQELGVPFTVASDAHSSVQQAENYDRLGALMQECGITEVSLYERHQRRVISVL